MDHNPFTMKDKQSFLDLGIVMMMVMMTVMIMMVMMMVMMTVMIMMVMILSLIHISEPTRRS